MFDASIALEPPQRLGAGREREPQERHEGHDEAEPEGKQQDAMEQRRRVAPEVEQRHDQEGRGDNERPEQRLPGALGKERKPTEAHLALEALGNRVVLGWVFRGGLGSRL